ncbi:MAG: VanW family protein [Candidatus Curtissbacteria bacterium]
MMSRKILIGVALVAVFFFIYSFIYRDRILPNTYFGSQNISGKDRLSASGLISQELADFANSPIVFKSGEKEFSAKPAEVGISFYSHETLDLAFTPGRTGAFHQDFSKRASAVFKKTQILPYYRIDFNRMAYFFDTQFSEIENIPQNATVGYQNGKLAILPEKKGVIVDRGKLTSDIFMKLDGLRTGPVEISLVEIKPKISSGGAEKAFSKVQALAKTKITLTYGYDAWVLGNNNLVGVLKFFPQGQESGYSTEATVGETKIRVNDAYLTDSPAQSLNVVVDENALDKFLADVANDVDRPTRDATLRFDGGKVIDFSPAVDGQKVDIEATRKLILAKVSVEDTEARDDVRLALPVVVTRARVGGSEVDSYGIRELVGKGVSYFGGSIANRTYNIGLASSRISGTIVAPGDVFSFNKSVGEVSGKTGYRQAYIISGGRTVLDDGGGICQVSTTLFRAALAAGLPIVSRTSHAYRVGYYEQRGFKPGLDATVWSPGVDFMFKNDMDNHILVQVVMDSANAKLEVDIYGTKDGRVVKLSDPVVTNVKPAPEARYQDDPTLPLGTVKQVDFSAVGSDSVFTRQVLKGDKLVLDDVFKSRYRPWQAVYLVGTGS